MHFKSPQFIGLALGLFFSTVVYAEDTLPAGRARFEEASLWKGVSAPLPKKGHYALPTGFTIEALLDGSIFSYNLLTPAMAVLEDDLTAHNEVVMPKGTRFIGVVEVVHTLDRVNIDFHTCVFPDGQEIKVSAMALSVDGSAGVKGKLETHKDAWAARIAMQTIATGVQAGTEAAAPSVGNAMASGLAQETSQSLNTPNAKELDSVSVEDRTPIRIFLRERTEY
jgi:type IV secretory pathway VirB10-like protein